MSRLSWTQFGLIFGLLFGLLPVTVFIATGLDQGVAAWFTEASNGPIRRQLGFQTGVFKEIGMNCTDFSWGITEVVAGGVFDRAGVRRGDVPFTVSWRAPDGAKYDIRIWYHGSFGARQQFYQLFNDKPPAGPIEFSVIPCSLQGKRHDDAKRQIRIALPER